MSYDLRIFEYPAGEAIPDSFEAAARVWSKLEAAEPGPNPKFAALAGRMMELGRDGDTPWIGDPLAEAEDCKSAVWGFSLPLESRPNLLHAVVKRANALGLTVLDEQLGLMFLPPARVLPPEEAEMWRAAAEELERSGWQWAPRKSWTLATVRKRVGSSLAAILEPHGFMAEPAPAKTPYYHQKPFAVYSRETPAGGQTVMLLGQTLEHTPFITVDVNVFSTAIADITRALLPENGESYARRQLAFWPGLFYGKRIYEPISSPDDLQPLLKALEGPVSEILALTRTSAGMEAVLGGAVSFPMTAPPSSIWPKTLAEHSQQTYGYAALISAWLHGNQQFETLWAEKRESDRRKAPPACAEEMAQRVDRVATYLRGHVPRVT